MNKKNVQEKLLCGGFEKKIIETIISSNCECIRWKQESRVEL